MTADITRQELLRSMLATGGAFMAEPLVASPMIAERSPTKGPRAITMWDFSWLERRWPGAGYEDWDLILDELVERGYDAIRIDVYPHLIAADPEKSWLLKPVWNTQDWGAPTFIRVRILPELYRFLEKCRDRHIKVGLSTWFREDEDNIRQQTSTPERLAAIWIDALRKIEQAGLLDVVLYVDLCNEWPGPIWATFVNPPLDWGQWADPRSLTWIQVATSAVRKQFPSLPLLFSSTGNFSTFSKDNTSAVDAIEQHLWMVTLNESEFYKQIGYNFGRFSLEDYHRVQFKAASLYRSLPEHWHRVLVDGIKRLASVARRSDKPLLTTECWAIVDYKDWPMLPWDWVKDVCALGTQTASATGQWLVIATSNFCGPQFQGMWRDVAWHQRLTRQIKSGPIQKSLRSGRLWDRL